MSPRRPRRVSSNPRVVFTATALLALGALWLAIEPPVQAQSGVAVQVGDRVDWGLRATRP